MTPTPKRKKTRRPRGLGTVYKRGNVYWIRYRDASGVFRQESTTCLRAAEAEDLLAQRLQQVREGAPTGPQVNKLTVDDLLELVRADYELRGLASLRTLLIRRGHLLRHFGGWKATAVTRGHLDAYLLKRTGQGPRDAAPEELGQQPVSRVTVKRELAALARGYELAVERKLIGPGFVPRLPPIEESAPREGFFDPDEFKAVLGHLTEPLRDAMLFAYWTGWRIQAEVLSLQWSAVDFEEGVVRLAKGSKQKRPFARKWPLEMSPPVAAMLRRRRALTDYLEEAGGRDRLGRPLSPIPWVFHRQGRPIKSYKDAWQVAIEKAGLPPTKLVHDFRRSAVRNLMRAGVQQATAKKLTGHKTDSVFERYNIIDDRDQRAAVAQLADYLKQAAG